VQISFYIFNANVIGDVVEQICWQHALVRGGDLSSDLVWRGDSLAEKMSTAAKDQLVLGAEMILARAKEEVPRATGALEESGQTEQQENSVVIRFDTPYATRQHEAVIRHPNPRDPRSTPGRKDHYLRDPFFELLDQVVENVAEAVKNVI
jgi:hypothetical protein